MTNFLQVNLILTLEVPRATKCPINSIWKQVAIEKCLTGSTSRSGVESNFPLPIKHAAWHPNSACKVLLLELFSKQCAVRCSQIEIYSRLHHLRHFQTLALFGFKMKKNPNEEKTAWFHVAFWDKKMTYLGGFKTQICLCLKWVDTQSSDTWWAARKTLLMNLMTLTYKAWRE